MVDIKSLGCMARYGLDMIRNAQSYKESLESVSADPRIVQVLTRKPLNNFLIGTFGLALYDMCADEKVPSDRNQVRINSSKMYSLMSVVDDIVDKKPLPLNDKLEFLGNVKSDLFGHASHSSTNIEENASYCLARSIHEGLLSEHGSSDLEMVSDKLLSLVKRQLVEGSRKALLDISKGIGSCCSESLAVLSEVITGKRHPAVRNSARKLGEYSQLLDDYCDLDNDLEEGTNTYPAICVREEGDTPSLRHELKLEMQSVADKSFAEGLTGLDIKRKTIYTTMKAIVDFRYRFW